MKIVLSSAKAPLLFRAGLVVRIYYFIYETMFVFVLIYGIIITREIFDESACSAFSGEVLACQCFKHYL